MTLQEKIALCKERYEIVKEKHKKPIFDIYDLSPLIKGKREIIQIDTTTGHREKFESIAEASRAS